MSERQYVLSLDKLDLSFLGHYIDRPTNEKKILWSKPCMDGESMYCKVQLPLDDFQDENYYVESLESSMCHICNIDVPQQYFKHHVKSGLHQTYKKLSEKILENVSKQINVIIESTNDNEQDNEFFCVTCSKVILLEHKQKHNRSNYHLKCVNNHKLLDNFVEIYVEKEQYDIKENKKIKSNHENNSDSDTDWDFDSEDENYTQVLSAHNINSCTVLETSAINPINNMNICTTAETLEVSSINTVNICRTIETPAIIPINNINTYTETEPNTKTPINQVNTCTTNKTSALISINKVTTPAFTPINKENKHKAPAIIPNTCKTSASMAVNKVSTFTTTETPTNTPTDNVNKSETPEKIANNNMNTYKTPEMSIIQESKGIKNNKALSMPPDISNEIVYFLYYLLDMKEKYEMEFDMPAVEQNSIVIVTPNGYIEKITIDVFHSYIKVNSYIFCQLCKLRVGTDTSCHSRTEYHVKNIMQPINNCFTRQMIGYKTWSHCLVCNDIVTNGSSHFDLRHKKYYEEKKSSCAGACSIPQNTNVNQITPKSPGKDYAIGGSSIAQINKSTNVENRTTTNHNLPSTSKVKPETAQDIEELTSEEKLNEYNKQIAEFNDIFVECLVCKLKIPNFYSNIIEHIEGIKHRRAVEELLGENKIEQKSFNQYECNICSKSFDDFVDHVQKNIGHRFLKGVLLLLTKFE